MNIIHNIISDEWLDEIASEYEMELVDGNIVVQLVLVNTQHTFILYIKPFNTTDCILNINIWSDIKTSEKRFTGVHFSMASTIIKEAMRENDEHYS